MGLNGLSDMRKDELQSYGTDGQMPQAAQAKTPMFNMQQALMNPMVGQLAMAMMPNNQRGQQLMQLGGLASQAFGKMLPPPGGVVQGQNPGRILMPSTPMNGGLGRFMGGQVPRIQPPGLRTFQAGGGQTAYNPFQQLRVADPRQFTPRISVDGMNMGGNFGPNVGIPQEPILSAPDSAFGGAAPGVPQTPQIAPQDFLRRILMQSY